MENPSFDDYVALIYNRFAAFQQAQGVGSKAGHPDVYSEAGGVVFFMWMQLRRIYEFSKQWRWLKGHPEALAVLGWSQVPDRSTLTRRYRRLAGTLQAFSLFLGQDSAALGEEFATQHLYEDKSLFKAQGNVWHQADRAAGHIPAKLRRLDTEATWCKSGYHGWVYGYGLHLTCNPAGFPVMAIVETATFSEKEAFARKAPVLLTLLRPHTLTADDAYTSLQRIRTCIRVNVLLITPALRWRTGRYALAYHRFLQQPDIQCPLRSRKSAIEPVFDLLAKLLGTTARQKQLPVMRLANVQTCLAIAVLSLQIAMIINSIWRLPLRSISYIQTAFA